MKVAALFVDDDIGIYTTLQGVDCYGKLRDARLYSDFHPIVAHPPCQLFGNFAKINYARWGGEHNKPGNDGGCFGSALQNLRRCGGVLEHPANSAAWDLFGLVKPICTGTWLRFKDLWTCEVWQSSYGHKARKKTWLLYAGYSAPFNMRSAQVAGTHQIGLDQREVQKPVLRGKDASATPLEFALELIRLAKHSRSIPR